MLLGSGQKENMKILVVLTYYEKKGHTSTVSDIPYDNNLAECMYRREFRVYTRRNNIFHLDLGS